MSALQIGIGRRLQGAGSTPFTIWETGGVTEHLGGVAATRRLLTSCRIARGQRVLDLGCGTGYTAALLASEEAHLGTRRPRPAELDARRTRPRRHEAPALPYVTRCPGAGGSEHRARSPGSREAQAEVRGPRTRSAGTRRSASSPAWISRRGCGRPGRWCARRTARRWRRRRARPTRTCGRSSTSCRTPGSPALWRSFGRWPSSRADGAGGRDQDRLITSSFGSVISSIA